MGLFLFSRKKREMQDKAVDVQVAKIGKPATKASKDATANILKLTTAIKQEDIVFNLYYATHHKEKK